MVSRASSVGSALYVNYIDEDGNEWQEVYGAADSNAMQRVVSAVFQKGASNSASATRAILEFAKDKGYGAAIAQAMASIGVKSQTASGRLDFRENRPSDAPRSANAAGNDAYFSGYWARVWDNMQTTNDALPGVLAPPLMPSILGGRVAEELGTTTALNWAVRGFGRMTMNGVTWSGLEVGVLAGATSAIAWVATGAAFEFGVLVGSMINAGYAR